MTAVEYVKIRARFMSWWPIPSLFLALGIATWSRFHMMGKHSVAFPVVAAVIMGPAIASVVIVATSVSFLQRRFERRHPEMAYLDEWHCLIGTEQNYPVTMAEKSDQVPRVKAILEEHARRANAAIAARKHVEVLWSKFPEFSPENAIVGSIQKYVAEVADGAMKSYQVRFELLDKMTLLAGITWFDARKYRESFLKKG